MVRNQEILILGAVEAIKTLAPAERDRKQLLKKTFPYLTSEDIDHWSTFYKL
jgi:hypothetical protein